MKNIFSFTILTIILLSFSCIYNPKKVSNINSEHAIQKTLTSDTAMVASARIEASKIAKRIMVKGGNAIDAAIATQMALAVCYPVAGNIGGGGFMIVRMNDGTIDALDFREAAPLAATKDMYLDDEGLAITNLSRTGHLAVGVPGTVDGMVKAFNKYSKLKDWKALVQPAIDLAKNGIIVTEIQAKLFNRFQKTFIKVNTLPNKFSQIKKWKKGDLLIQKELAHTLELIRDQGRAGFYEGEVAKKIVAEMTRSNGIITKKDLTNYHAIWRRPITTDYRGHKIISMPPPSSGGIALVQLLEMIEPHDLNSMGWNSTASVHLMVEAERRVYADRSKHLGDSDFYSVPISTLLDKNYIADRMSNFNPEEASSSEDINAGDTNHYLNESTETTHYSIVDPYGNAISITTTLNGYYGSKVLVGGAGFFLNNEMDDFSAKPGVPNMFGLLGAEANKIEPEKRMLSSMTPTIVENNNDLMMSLGTPGGSTIITSVFQTIVNVIDHGMTIDNAVKSERFHHQWKPNLIKIEPNAFSPIVMDELVKMGHEIKSKPSIGRVEAILFKDGIIHGVADPRGDDDVRGY